MPTDILSAALAYIVPTFPLGYFWHLTVFKERYRALEIYRENVSPPLGLTSMVIQGIAFAIIYRGVFAAAGTGWVETGIRYAALGGLLSWSFTTLAWAAKGRVTSLRTFFALETAFTVLQWLVVGLLTAFLLR
jgi:hypothetical protein